MNKLNNTRVYLAGNIENTTSSTNWRQRFTQFLAKLNVKVLDPTISMFENDIGEADEEHLKLLELRRAGNLDEVHERMAVVVGRDLRAISLVDWVIVRLEPGKPTFGTIHEIVQAKQEKKPILIFFEGATKNECPLWILGLIKPENMFNNEQEILEYILMLNCGEKKMNERHWKFLHDCLR